MKAILRQSVFWTTGTSKGLTSCTTRLLPAIRQQHFSISRRNYALNNSLTEAQLGVIQIDRERLWKDLHTTCEFGKGERWGEGDTDTGMSRLALTDSDKQARDWFVETTKSLGCEVKVDEMGNIFAIRPGEKEGTPTCMGSHLDTQPTGGRYDGILGIHAGIEALKTLQAHDITTSYPVGLINWTNEEGARFPVSMCSSGVWSGSISLSTAHNLPSITNNEVTQKSELERIGYRGPVPASHEHNPIGAHFELHIEQGPILESSGAKIGAVAGAQAYKWFTVTVQGRDCHTGTTDFANRSDALLSASKMIVHSHNRATELECLASTGVLSLRPGSTNTVPGYVSFSLDIRSPEDAKVEELEATLRRDFEGIAKGEDVDGINSKGTRGSGCSVEWRLDSDTKATKFDEDCIRCVEESAGALFGAKASEQVRRMTSGAGHDSVYTSRRVPTSMIFVPCRDGVSHNPAEYCSPEDCGNGAQVLLGAVLRYDRLRTRQIAQKFST